MPEIRKFLSGPATVLGDRQVRVRCSSGAIDRMGDIIVQAGIQHEPSVPVLWSHDPEKPVGRAAPQLIDGELYAVVDFAPAGISKHVDEICGLVKATIIRGVSVGFDPIEQKPIDPKNPYGGQKYTQAELLEISFVSIAANADAEVVARSRKSGRVLSGANREKLEAAVGHHEAGMKCLRDVLDAAAGTEPQDTDPNAAGGSSGTDPGGGKSRLVNMTRAQRIARAKALALARISHAGAVVLL